MALDVMWTSAKDFGRWPELAAVHGERLRRARRAAERYLAPSGLLGYGLMMFEDVVGAAYAAEVAAAARAVRPGDAKRPDSTVSARPNGDSARAVAETVWELIAPLWRGHRQAAAEKLRVSTYLQHLVNAPGDGDIQKVAHRDTFFPALKFWYFPEEVGIEDGAFCYARGSAGLTGDRMAWECEQANLIARGEIEPWHGVGHREGSFRVSGDELAELGFALQPVEVAADTLVIANVFGFHARGEPRARCSRVSIHGSIRIDRPFEDGLPRVEPEDRLS